MNDKLLSKIEKLLNLGNGSSYEGEASTALKRAYDLMHEHGISFEDVQMHSKDEILGTLGSEYLSEDSKQYRKWEVNLFVSISKLFDCKTLISGYHVYWDKKTHLVIVGREGNRTTAKLMYNWIHDKTMKEAKAIGDCPSSRNAYCIGVTDSLRRKINEIKNPDTGKTDKWGIVPLNEVENWINQSVGKLEDYKMSNTVLRDFTAYSAGTVEGNNISLNRQFAATGIEDNRG
jgi:hypothetical protein